MVKFLALHVACDMLLAILILIQTCQHLILLSISVKSWIFLTVFMLECKDAKQWRDLSYCLAQLSYTDKSLKKMIELFPKYQNALGVDEVVEHFKTIVAKVRL